MKRIFVAGAGGFIGSHLVKSLKADGHWVRAVDLRHPEFAPTAADEFIIGDLREKPVVQTVLNKPFDEVYQLAAEMGGAGYIFTGDHDAEVLYNSATINLNMIEGCRVAGARKILCSSSACVYPIFNQQDPWNPQCAEDSAYPAAPGNRYGIPSIVRK